MYKIGLFLMLFMASVSLSAQSEITEHEIKDHIQFLTLDKNIGRPPGGAANRRVVRYLSKAFKTMGLSAFNKNYKQAFKTQIRVVKTAAEKPPVKTYNVIGFIPGNDPQLKNEYIVLGAHYDHLGWGGGPTSKSKDTHSIHYGADDNASGTAALLEIAEKLISKKAALKRSIIFIAFGAEEQGLIGSKYFTEHPTVPLSQIKLMINLDMVGRMNAEKHVYMGGAGTFPDGVNFMTALGKSIGVTPVVHAGSIGGSDHVSFYKKGISVLGIHTGGHPQYHTPEDTIDLINLPGEKKVCEYVFKTIYEKATTNAPMHFIPQD